MSVSEFEKRLVGVLKANCHRYLGESALLVGHGLQEVADTSTECGHDLARAVEVLRLQGYEIDGDQTRGWCLIRVPDTLNYLEIESGLKTTFLGRSLFTYRIIGSTSDTAKMLAEAGVPDGSLLVAEEQARGRGRFENTWYSPPGTGIWASLILRPGISPSQLGILGLLCAFCICLAVEEQTGLRPRLKWPNDLYLGDRKFAGVLCESGIQAGRVKYVILGFGVNVNIESFPESVSGTATSLRIASAGERVDRVSLLQKILDKLEEGYFKLLTDGFSLFLPRIQVRDYLRDRKVTVATGGGETIGGIARGIDENGALLLEVPESSHLRAVAQGRVVEY
ncbi:MAG: biotin--[acetyl-CoA-carboxylase] ligase [Candidatus Glassbacteria bacterium]|nr:biotin--[acetyl-CoA-carboxylase] ligase [Candidatus Glassbacteria bacterium]